MHNLPIIPYVAYDANRPPTRERGGKTRRTRGESPEASYAFHLYAALPPGERTYQGVLDMLVVEGKMKPTSKRLIEKWGAKWDWQERVKVADAMRIEEKRRGWEREREQMHLEVAEASKKAFDRVAEFLEDRLKAGRVNTEAAVQLMKVAADLRHRAYNELTDKGESKQQNLGIQIIIDTDRDVGQPPGATVPRAQVLEVRAPLGNVPDPGLVEGAYHDEEPDGAQGGADEEDWS